MKHYNITLNKTMQDTFNLKGESTDEVFDGIVPVIPLNPRIDIVKSASATNATNAIIFTTPIDKDFYLTHASLSVIKDATSTSIVSAITVTIDGVVPSIIQIAGITLTPQISQLVLCFNYPIKIDRGTQIRVTNSTNVGNIRADGCISGFTVETTKNT